MNKTLLAVLAALPVAGCLDGSEDNLSVTTSDLTSAVSRDIAAARAATAKYHDVATAEADGYFDTGLPCIEGQGYHYINPSLIGTMDVSAPQLLMYAPNNGKLKLDALEWLQPIAEGGSTARPTLFGEVFHGPETVPGVPFSFFALHVWAWTENPDGMFADPNPRIHCP